MFSKDLHTKIKEAFEKLGNLRQVGRNFGVSHQTVKYIVETDQDKPKKKRGRKFKLNRAQTLAIRREVRKANDEGRKLTAQKVKELCSIDNLCSESVRLNLRRLHFVHKDAFQTIVLTKKHKQRRVELAKYWLRVGHRWNCTIFSDEKKFNLDGPDDWSTYTDENRTIYRNKRQMGGGSVMIWAMLLPNGFIHIERLEGKIDANHYISTLSTAFSILNNIYCDEVIVFQHDNASVHTASSVGHFLSG